MTAAGYYDPDCDGSTSTNEGRPVLKSVIPCAIARVGFGTAARAAQLALTDVNVVDTRTQVEADRN